MISQGLRGELLQLSWVKDARVSRQLPDTLVVDVIERSPHAVLRREGKLTLIDETGHPLEAVSPAKAKGLLVLSGNKAEVRVPDLVRLLDAAPALRPQVAEAEWIGNRRWNLTFKTRQVLALPEGEDKSASALVTFARMDGVDRLLGGQVASFDMRSADRIYMRVPGRAEAVAAAARADMTAKANAAAAKTQAARSAVASAAPDRFQGGQGCRCQDRAGLMALKWQLRASPKSLPPSISARSASRRLLRD